jgi:nitroreductase
LGSEIADRLGKGVLMDVLDVIRTRRSIRRYTGSVISQEDVNRILEAGRWAPSADNSQPWTFVVLRSLEMREKLAGRLPWGGFLSQAALGIAVVIDETASTHAVEDGAAATENMLLEAHSLGLGACWIGTYGSPHEASAKKVLKVPEDKRLLSVIAVGYPAETARTTRKPLTGLVFTDQYGRR